MVPMNNRLLRTKRRRPDAPRILTANQTDGLMWTMPACNGARITEYRVYADGNLLDVTPGDMTAFYELPVPGIVYQVAAVNAVGEGPQSNPATAT